MKVLITKKHGFLYRYQIFKSVNDLNNILKVAKSRGSCSMLRKLYFVCRLCTTYPIQHRIRHKIETNSWKKGLISEFAFNDCEYSSM